jgi:hypothetical protein
VCGFGLLMVLKEIDRQWASSMSSFLGESETDSGGADATATATAAASTGGVHQVAEKPSSLRSPSSITLDEVNIHSNSEVEMVVRDAVCSDGDDDGSSEVEGQEPRKKDPTNNCTEVGFNAANQAAI